MCSFGEFSIIFSFLFLFQAGSIQIRGVDSQVNYSTSQRIHRTGGTADDPFKEHNVLLLSINNAIYPIDVVRLEIFIKFSVSFFRLNSDRYDGSAAVQCRVQLIDWLID